MGKSDIQGFKASHARFLKARDAGGVDLPVYFGRPPEVDAAIDACMAEHGRRHCRRRDYLGMGKDGLELWAVIMDSAGEIVAAFDFSWICPPICEDE